MMLHEYSAQGSFLKYENYHPGATNHYLCIGTALNGELQIPVLQKAISKIIERHDALRSCLTRDEQGYVLNVNNSRPHQDPIKIIDISDQNISCTSLQNALAAANESAFLSQPFDMEKGPLWRAILIRTAPEQYHFSFLIHPLIADDRSINILLAEIQSYYNQDINGVNLDLQLPHPSTPQTEISDEKRKEYWQNKLENLNIIKPHTPKSYTGVMRFHGKHKPVVLERELVEKLKNSFPGFTLEQILLTSLHALMQRYTGETDITLGTTDPNRPLSDRQINACANWLTLRLRAGIDESFADLLQKTASERADALTHQLPIENLYQSVLTDGDRAALRTTAPFDILLNFNNKAPRLILKNMSASAVKEIDLGYNSSSLFKLNLNQLENGSCEGFINYNTDLFDDETIDRMLGHLQNILQTAAAQPECKIDDIPLLLESEIKLITEFNQTRAAAFYNEQQTPDIFNSIATQKENQNLPALVFHPLNAEAERLTYQELDAYSNQIANYLRETCGMKKGDHIAISLTRSVNLVAVMLGALKAGLVVVPLDTSPSSLLDHKFKTANAARIITDQHTNAMFANKNIIATNIDDADVRKDIKATRSDYQSANLTPDSPAYIMYSSGTSTGIPKASLLTHGGLANLFNALHDQKYAPGLKVLCTALPTFDAFLFDFLAAWRSQGSVHLTTDAERYSPEAIERIIRKENINFAAFLPDLMTLLPEDLPLEYTISMGAAAREGTFERWLLANPKRSIINGMGHTETGICLTLQLYRLGNDPDLVGEPISNMQAFILDPVHHTLCPIGVPGELYVAGPALASEYIDDPGLTNKHYVTMKFDAERSKFSPCAANDPNAIRMYASGDFLSYQLTSTGEISLKSHGRNDRRCKIYGVSIDLDGVEAMLYKDSLVKAVTVTPNKDSTGLIAYIVTNEKFAHIISNPNKAKTLIRSHLKDTPLHPVAYPKYIRFLTELPKTSNGKIALKQLPPPLEHELHKPYRNQDLTQTITNMWRNVIASDAIDDKDTNATFIELGGNSMALSQLEIKINSELPLTKRIGVGPNALSMNMSINGLANAIKPFLKTDNTPPNKVPHSSNAFSKFKKNHTSLLANKSQNEGMNPNNTSIQKKIFSIP